MLDSRHPLHRTEAEFFDDLYNEQRYHPLGWRLRLQRDLASLLRYAGAARLGRVLSLGCGDGQFELMLAPYAEEVIGIDLSPQAIQRATQSARQAGVDNVRFYCMPLEEFAWQETYDVVVCLAFLHHLPAEAVPPLLNRIACHLTPNGIFYSLDPNRNAILRHIVRALFPDFYHRFHSPDERELDPSELRWQLLQAGFASVHIGYSDLVLIPMLFALAHGPAWVMHVAQAIDRLWCHSPLAPWASGFFAVARKGGACPLR